MFSPFSQKKRRLIPPPRATKLSLQEHRAFLNKLIQIIEGTASQTGDNFVHSLVFQMAAAMNSRYALVGKLSACENRVEVVACCDKDKPLQQFAYDLKGTPCETVLNGELCIYEKDVQKMFPQDQILKQMNVDSYMGISLLGSKKEVLGLIAVLDENPSEDTAMNRLILQIFAERVAVELERARTMGRVEKSEQRLREYFQLGLIGMAITSPEKGWIEINDKLCEILGYSREEMKQKTWVELTHTDDVAEDVANFEEVVAGRTNGYSMEKRFYHKNGNIVYASISVKCIRGRDGRVDHFMALVSDVTEQKNYEQALETVQLDLEKRVVERTHELAEANELLRKEIIEREEAQYQQRGLQARLIQADKLASIGRLSAGVAHELNSPLAGLLGLLRINKKVLKKSGSGGFEYVDEMIEAGEQMARIISDLNSFGRPAALEVEALDIIDVIESTLSFSWTQLKNVQIELKKEFSKDLPSVMGVRGKLQQVVLNIITNARDAMPDGGQLVIRVYVASESKKVVVEFEDNGSGMNEEVLAKIFEPFFTTKSQGAGVGLGLWLSYGIMKTFGGALKATSAVGKGSKFFMELPVRQTREEAKRHEGENTSC